MFGWYQLFDWSVTKQGVVITSRGFRLESTENNLTCTYHNLLINK